MEEQGDTLTILEEYASGKEIDSYVKDEIKGDVTGEVVHCLIEVCDALSALHGEEPPIIHRDVKPSNILVGDDGHVFLVDFDASRIYKESGEKDTRTLGTQDYAPPEQYGFKQTDVRSDIYSFGVVAKELFDTEETSLHPELKRIIDSCMAFDPDKRFSSIDEVKKALENYKSAGSRRALRRVCAVVVGAAVISLAGAGIYRLSVNRINSVSGTAVVAEPTATPYDGEVEDRVLDYTNPETGERNTAILYYALEEKEKTPIRIFLPMVIGKDLVKRIKIQREGRFNTTEISQEYWNQDSYGVLTIDNAYLDTLNENETYDVSLDCDSVVLSFKLKAVAHCKDATEDSWVSFIPGYQEYLKTEPRDMKWVIKNGFGRKLIKIVNLDTGEQIDESLYDTETEPGFLIVKKDIFEAEEDGSYLNFEVYFEELEGVLNLEKVPFTVCVRNRAYIPPEIEPRDFLVNLSEPEDIVIHVTWNDGKDKLESIYSKENVEDQFSKKQYEVTEDGVIIKKEALKKLKPGSYTYMLEFGDVGISFTITVK